MSNFVSWLWWGSCSCLPPCHIPAIFLLGQWIICEARRATLFWYTFFSMGSCHFYQSEGLSTSNVPLNLSSGLLLFIFMCTIEMATCREFSGGFIDFGELGTHVLFVGYMHVHWLLVYFRWYHWSIWLSQNLWSARYTSTRPISRQAQTFSIL